MKKLILIFLLFLTACVPHPSKNVFLYWPTDECVREYARTELHRDWPKAILIMQGDDLTIIAEPEKGAKSDYYIIDTAPRCK